MKRMDFIKEKETDKLIAVVKNDGINSYDGSTIRIKYNVLKQGLKQGVFIKCTYGERGNVFYDCGDITFLNIKKDEVTVLDSIINGVKIEDIFKKKSISINRSKNNRGICRVNISKVRHHTRNKKDIVVSDNSYPVSINLVLNDIALGKVDSQVKDIKYYDIIDRHGHHNGHCWDNRVAKAIAMTKQQHKQHHSKEDNGEESHQTICIIDTLEKLIAFIEYLRINK